MWLLSNAEIRTSSDYWAGASDNATQRLRTVAKAQLKKWMETDLITWEFGWEDKNGEPCVAMFISPLDYATLLKELE